MPDARRPAPAAGLPQLLGPYTSSLSPCSATISPSSPASASSSLTSLARSLLTPDRRAETFVPAPALASRSRAPRSQASHALRVSPSVFRGLLSSVRPDHHPFDVRFRCQPGQLRGTLRDRRGCFCPGVRSSLPLLCSSTLECLNHLPRLTQPLVPWIDSHSLSPEWSQDQILPATPAPALTMVCSWTSASDHSRRS
jgi:hypothetical protein